MTDAATVAQANSVATATTGTVQFSGGITDSTTNLMNGDSSAISTGLSTAKTDDSDVVITANTAVTVAQFNLLDAATSSAIVLSGGISDTAANLAPSGTASSGLTNSTAQDADVAITITGTAPTVDELNKIASLTTGVVTASISGNKTTLAGLTTASTDAVTATVTDAVTVAEFNTLDGKTSVGVILTGGVSDAAAAYAATTGTATSGRTCDCSTGWRRRTDSDGCGNSCAGQ